MSIGHALLFRKLATVYTASPSTGLFDVVAKTALPCNLLTVNTQAAPTSADRAQLAAERTFVWHPDYQLPTHCQVEVDGARWDPVDVNAFDALPGPNGQIHHRRAPVRKAA